MLVRRFWPRILIVLSILGSFHLYMWWRLIAPLPEPWRCVGTVVVCLGMPSFVASMIVSRKLTRESRRVLLMVGYMWFGIATYLMLGAIISNIAVAFGAPPTTMAAIGGIGAICAVVYGILHVRRGAQVKRVELALPGLGVPEYRVVQLTDVHIGTMLGQKFAQDVVDKVNALEPDLIVITGDFVDGNLHELRADVEPFRDLRAKDGVYSVTGNHEYYWQTEEWMEHIRSLGIRVLRNERVTIDGVMQVAGVDDSSQTEDVPRAVEGRDPNLPLVLLAHHPSTIRRSQDKVDLQLSGHTHGGQLLPLGWLARLFEPAVAGFAKFGRTWLYVSEGTGYWGPPMRVGTTQEITHLTLRRAQRA
ncbi:metallophosphoesterase [soil metagenome]